MQTKNYWEISLKSSDGEGMMIRERERERDDCEIKMGRKMKWEKMAK